AQPGCRAAHAGHPATGLVAGCRRGSASQRLEHAPPVPAALEAPAPGSLALHLLDAGPPQGDAVRGVVIAPRAEELRRGVLGVLRQDAREELAGLLEALAAIRRQRLLEGLPGPRLADPLRLVVPPEEVVHQRRVLPALEAHHVEEAVEDRVALAQRGQR